MLTVLMPRCHNTAFFPQGAGPCIYLMPLENIVTPQLNCERGLAITSRIPKFGSCRDTIGTSSESLLAASKTWNESARLVQCTTVMVSRLAAAEHKSLRRLLQSCTMTDSTEFSPKKRFAPETLSFTRTQEEKSRTQASLYGERSLNS